MTIIGILIAIGAGLAFAVIGALVLWGGSLAIRHEVLSSFQRAPAATPGGLPLTILGLAVPMVVVALLSFYATIRIFQMAFGMGI